ncbi:hypothetical protein L249_5081, partial [Ophiocordyceps polyrhachis-furcata BCC 54312]
TPCLLLIFRTPVNLTVSAFPKFLISRKSRGNTAIGFASFPFRQPLLRSLAQRLPRTVYDYFLPRTRKSYYSSYREEKDAFYDITNALCSNAALTPAERLGLEPNTENYKVDRILNIRKIKRSKGIIITIPTLKTLIHYLITTICPLPIARRIKLRQLPLPYLPYCRLAKANLPCYPY